MTENEKAFSKIETLNNQDLGAFYKKVSGKNPFDGSVILPSDIRRAVLKKIKHAISTGRLKFEPVQKI